jgi:aminoglycoside 6'-N-acetyltransferase
VTLERVQPAHHEALIAEWLRRPHVSPWWGDAESRMAQFRATPGSQHALIAVGGVPAGYLRWQTVDRAVLATLGLGDIPDGAVDIDILIGEPAWVGRGVGPAALRSLLERLAQGGAPPLAGLCPSVDNAAAIRAFGKAGFRKLREVDDPVVGRCWVLVADLAPARPADPPGAWTR